MASRALKRTEVPYKTRCPPCCEKETAAKRESNKLRRKREMMGPRKTKRNRHKLVVGSSASKSPVAALTSVHTGPHRRSVVWRLTRSRPVTTLTSVCNRAPLWVDRVLCGGKGPVATQTSECSKRHHGSVVLSSATGIPVAALTSACTYTIADRSSSAKRVGVP